MSNGKIKIDKTTIRRRNKSSDDGDEELRTPPPVTAGAVERVLDFAFNPSRDKIREVTVVDRIQGKLLPQLDLVNTIWDYVIEVAEYRQNSTDYRKAHKRIQPSLPDLISEFIYRTAQWQKSVRGTNLKSAIDLALAETEARAGEQEGFLPSGFED